MNKEFIPYTQALALKELGFDEPCFGSWGVDCVKIPTYTHCISNFYKNSNHPVGKVTAPTYSQAFRWFREKHILDSIVQPTYSTEYQFRVFNVETKFKVQVYGDYMSKEFNTYEEAENACLIKLIEIVKTK